MAQKMLATPTHAYTGELIPGMNADQQQAGNLIRNSYGAFTPYFDQARNALGMGMQSINPQTMAQGLQNIGQYMNPYTSSVIDAAQAAGSRALGNNLNQIRDGALRSGSAYGSRHVVQEGVAAAENAYNQQQFAANALSDAFGKAAGYLGGDITNNMQAQQQNAANAQNVGNSLSNLATSQRTAQAADMSNLLNYGTQAQENQTAQNQAAYQEFQRMQALPWNNLTNYTNVLAGSPRSTTSTSNTNSTSIGYQPQQQTSSSPIMSALGMGMSALPYFTPGYGGVSAMGNIFGLLSGKGIR